MSTPIVRRRKRPVEVATIQWTGHNIDDLIDFTGGDFLLPEHVERIFSPEFTAKVYDSIHNTWVRMKTGHHVVRGIQGELYPIAEDVLAETYEPVDEGFFRPGHTYAEVGDTTDWKFRCDTATTHPEDGERTALGWRHFRGEWEPYAYGEDDWEIHRIVDHIDVTEAGDRHV